EREENVLRGKEMVDRELKRLGVSQAELMPDLLKWFRAETPEDFYASVGFGGISLSQIAGRIGLHLRRPEQEPEAGHGTATVPREVTGQSIRVLGTGDILTQMARCCTPVPGDDIIGYVTRARGVTVHRKDCVNVRNSPEKERFVEVEWGERGHHFPVAVKVE